MEFDRYEHGVPSWVDVSTPDLEASRAFYGGLFGWDVTPGPPEIGGYTNCSYKGRAVAGIGPKMNPEGPTAWLTYVNVDSADEALDKVKANGGTVLFGPTDVMEFGRMGIFTDPFGGALGVWQPRLHKGAGIANEPNTYTWSELITTEVPASKAFYGAVFGWDAVTEGPEGPGGYTEWRIGDHRVGGLMYKPDAIPAGVPPFWGVYFAVSDVDASVTRIRELGGSIMVEPMEIEPGRFAVGVDPIGASFSVIQLKEGLV